MSTDSALMGPDIFGSTKLYLTVQFAAEIYKSFASLIAFRIGESANRPIRII
ncbi:hypothetical protein [Methylobacterium sp.]|uniref:hypothetical protein n=1 Tax=Methylobacterium sp. TaxID=409 RepID=UPI003B00A026